MQWLKSSEPDGYECDGTQHVRPYVASFVVDAEDALEAFDERREHRTVRIVYEVVVLHS